MPAKKKTTKKKKPAAKKPAPLVDAAPEVVAPLDRARLLIDPAYETANTLLEVLPKVADGDVLTQRTLAELHELTRLHKLLDKLVGSSGLFPKLAPDYKKRGITGEDGPVLLSYDTSPGRNSVSWKDAAVHYGRLVTEKVDGAEFDQNAFEEAAKNTFGTTSDAKVKAVLTLK